MGVNKSATRRANRKATQLFELLLSSGGNDQWVLPFQHSLARLGIDDDTSGG
jgi:microcin C transport system substrate-binding protein